MGTPKKPLGENAQIERSYRKVAGKNAGKKKKTSNNAAVIGLCAAAVAVLIALLAILYFFLSTQGTVIAKNITIAGVNVGGLTKQEAISLVTSKIGDDYETTTMTVTVLDQTVEIPPEVSKAKLDVKGAVAAALEYRPADSTEELHPIDLGPYLGLDEAAIREKLSVISLSAENEPKPTTVEVVGSMPNLSDGKDASASKYLKITKGVPENNLNIENLYRGVVAAYSDRVFSPTLDLPLTEPEMPDLEEIYRRECAQPVDAVMDPETYEVTPEQYGYAFDIAVVTEAIQKAEYGEELHIPFSFLDPQVKQEDLTKDLFRDTIATFTTDFPSDPDRNVNLKLACNAVDGTKILPGKSFSFNSVVGSRTPGAGYREYANCEDENELDVGSGVCQVATAIYNAAILADLNIVEYHPHECTQDYAQPGLDAKVFWGEMDLRFENTTADPIRIEASANGGTVTVSIVGTDKRDYYVRIECNTVKKTEYEVEYETLEPQNPEGYEDGDVMITPRTGYVIEVIRKEIEKSTGNVLITSPLQTVTYEVRNKLICSIVEPQTTAPTTETTP